MGCKPLDDIAHSGHRNIKISGDGLVALRLSMFFPKKIISNPQTTLYTSFFSPCSVWHTTQRLSQLFSILTGYCYLLQVCLNTNYRSTTCLKSNYFLQFWQGANHFVQSIFEFCVKFYQVWLFFSVFLCCCSANKNNKYMNAKTFAIGTIFWEKCCILHNFLFWKFL